MSVSRSVPSSVAAVLGELELQRPTVVTTGWLTRAVTDLGLAASPDTVLRQLRSRGWLLPLRVQGAWEFAPGDRAGAVSGGDPFIEVCALALVKPQLLVAVGFESAAFLRSLSSRPPAREVIVCAEGTPPIRALDHLRRVDLTVPQEAYTVLGGLSVATRAGLLAAIAIRPGAFGDWPGLAGWLSTAATDVDSDQLVRLLAGRPAAAWARAGYLLRRGGNVPTSDRLLAARPPGAGPFYLGPRRPGGTYDAAADVVDSVVGKFAETGQGRS